MTAVKEPVNIDDVDQVRILAEDAAQDGRLPTPRTLIQESVSEEQAPQVASEFPSMPLSPCWNGQELSLPEMAQQGESCPMRFRATAKTRSLQVVSRCGALLCLVVMASFAQVVDASLDYDRIHGALAVETQETGQLVSEEDVVEKPGDREGP